MSRHHVSVSQLNGQNHGNRPDPFLNVIEDAYNGIGVWGSCYNMPTYLLQREYEFRLIQFGDQECADEWLEENSKNFIVTKLEKEKE